MFPFEWGAPEGCPAREAVLQRAEQLLGRALADAAPSDLAVAGGVERRGQTWHLELREHSATGTRLRSVEAASCDELGDAAALLIALTIDPSLPEREPRAATGAFPIETRPAKAPQPAPEPSATPLPPPRPPASKPAPSAPPARPEESRPLQACLGASASVWVNRLPGPTPGVLAQGGVGVGPWLGLGQLGFFPERHASLNGSRAGGDFRLASAGAELAHLFALGRVRLGPSAGAELQWVHGSGTGVKNPTDADVMLISLQAGVRASVPISPSWSLGTSGVFSWLANRPRFVLDAIGPVFQPERWGVRFGVGAEWRSP